MPGVCARREATPFSCAPLAPVLGRARRRARALRARCPPRSGRRGPSIASPEPGRSSRLAWAGLSLEAGMSSATTISSPTPAVTTGRRITKPAQRPQKPCPRTRRRGSGFGSSRMRLIRVPEQGEQRRQQGDRASTETAGISIPPIPIARMKGRGRMIMLSRPIATVEPDTTTERPARRIVCATPPRRPRPSRAPRGSGRSSAASSRSPPPGPTSAIRNCTMIETSVR